MNIYTWFNQKGQKKYAPGVSISMIVLAVGLMFSTVSCSDYLDVVPDNVTTLDNAPPESFNL